MAVDPEAVVDGAWYRADSGQDRLVWAIRGGLVCYFQRDQPDQPWICTQPPDPFPPVERFAAEVSLVHLDGAAVGQTPGDAYGEGDW